MEDFGKDFFGIDESRNHERSYSGTPPFRGHKIWPRKNVYITFLFVTSIEGPPLFRGHLPWFRGQEGVSAPAWLNRWNFGDLIISLSNFL